MYQRTFDRRIPKESEAFKLKKVEQGNADDEFLSEWPFFARA